MNTVDDLIEAGNAVTDALVERIGLKDLSAIVLIDAWREAVKKARGAEAQSGSPPDARG